MKKFNTVNIQTAFPTVVGTPKDTDEAELAEVKTRTKVGWPDNWHKLSAFWRAKLASQLVLRVISFVFNEDKEGLAEFKRLTGWGTGNDAAPTSDVKKN